MPEHPGLVGDSPETQIGPDAPSHILVLDLRNGTQENAFQAGIFPVFPSWGKGCEYGPHQLCD